MNNALFTIDGDLTAVPANDNQLRALGAAIGKHESSAPIQQDSSAVHLPSTNPKRAFGVKKPSAQFIPPVALIEESAVMALGAAKYGAFNWQDDPVDASTYYSAAIRHLLQWFSGEDVDQESGASHLAHVRACMAILIDAKVSGKLIDDRPKCAPASEAIDRLRLAA
ncbi:dATP/dGTP diphosphohydrolase domain-containing protein [Rhizobium leucaenae]|uniref:dATP/dGTP diphosphohydrolase domain-containing protein n=1 Tax=Rhizobium leucaenae TaxID=29450 RepID=UPI0009EE2333|nr:dATP/dGTP diphosphohydrolase domain-containing protein [Rhizobium leucaenae]